MSDDFLSRFLQPSAAIPKEIVIDGEKGTVYFKRISAGQRASLLKGQRISRNAGEIGSTFDIDLGESTIAKHRLVLFSCCFEDGKARFRNLADVQAADSLIVEKLYELASEVNKEADDEDAPGKS